MRGLLKNANHHCVDRVGGTGINEDQFPDPEQELVVNHPLGCHARVLTVAGSGKSTTMAHRIKHLVTEYQVYPGLLQVLMFNTLARKQFTSHLDKVGLPANLQPPDVLFTTIIRTKRLEFNDVVIPNCDENLLPS